MRRDVSLFTWSGAQNCSAQSWAGWWVLPFSLRTNRKSWGWTSWQNFIGILVLLAFLEVMPQIHHQFSLCFHFLTAAFLPVLILFAPPHTHTHTHCCQFSDSYREQWRSECVCHCLSRKWDLGEWMEEFWRRNAIIRKAAEKRMDCYRYGLPQVLIYLSIRLSYRLFGHSLNDSEPLLCQDSAVMNPHNRDNVVISHHIIIIYKYY